MPHVPPPTTVNASSSQIAQVQALIQRLQQAQAYQYRLQGSSPILQPGGIIYPPGFTSTIGRQRPRVLTPDDFQRVIDPQASGKSGSSSSAASGQNLHNVTLQIIKSLSELNSALQTNLRLQRSYNQSVNQTRQNLTAFNLRLNRANWLTGGGGRGRGGGGDVGGESGEFDDENRPERGRRIPRRTLPRQNQPSPETNVIGSGLTGGFNDNLRNQLTRYVAYLRPGLWTPYTLPHLLLRTQVSAAQQAQKYAEFYRGKPEDQIYDPEKLAERIYQNISYPFQKVASLAGYATRTVGSVVNTAASGVSAGYQGTVNMASQFGQYVQQRVSAIGNWIDPNGIHLARLQRTAPQLFNLTNWIWSRFSNNQNNQQDRSSTTSSEQSTGSVVYSKLIEGTNYVSQGFKRLADFIPNSIKNGLQKVLSSSSISTYSGALSLASKAALTSQIFLGGVDLAANVYTALNRPLKRWEAEAGAGSFYRLWSWGEKRLMGGAITEALELTPDIRQTRYRTEGRYETEIPERIRLLQLQGRYRDAIDLESTMKVDTFTTKLLEYADPSEEFYKKTLLQFKDIQYKIMGEQRYARQMEEIYKYYVPTQIQRDLLTGERDPISILKRQAASEERKAFAERAMKSYELGMRYDENWNLISSTPEGLRYRKFANEWIESLQKFNTKTIQIEADKLRAEELGSRIDALKIGAQYESSKVELDYFKTISDIALRKETMSAEQQLAAVRSAMIAREFSLWQIGQGQFAQSAQEIYAGTPLAGPDDMAKIAEALIGGLPAIQETLRQISDNTAKTRAMNVLEGRFAP